MKSCLCLGSPGTRRAPLLLTLTFATALMTSCAAPQPEECAAFLACFYPEGAESPYTGAVDAGLDDLAELGAGAIASYGPDGECWRNGESDPLYKTCRDACIGAMLSECDAEASGARDGICVEGSGQVLDFVPPQQDALRQSCAQLAGS